MTKNNVRADGRRRFLRDTITVAGGSAILGSSMLWPRPGFAQDPPGGCPNPPSGGTPFQPGQDQRPIVVRKSISSLTSAELTTLQNAFSALRGLGSNDP